MWILKHFFHVLCTLYQKFLVVAVDILDRTKNEFHEVFKRMFKFDWEVCKTNRSQKINQVPTYFVMRIYG